MRIIGVAMVKNEADIIEAFVRYHARLFDHLLVLDHASSDATPGILASLVAEGLPLSVLRDEDPAFRQAERLTALIRDALPRHGADYAFALDADEFVRVGSRAELELALAAAGHDEVLNVPWLLYVAPVDRTREAHPLRRVCLRADGDSEPLHKVVLRPSFARNGWRLAPGSHYVIAEQGGSAFSPRAANLPGVTLAHLPFRSTEQFLAKVLLGWLGTRLEQGTNANTGLVNAHWRTLFHEWLSGMEPTPADLQRVALWSYVVSPGGGSAPREMRFVHDPLPADFELRYTSPEAADPLRRLAHWTDALLDRVSEHDAVAS